MLLWLSVVKCLIKHEVPVVDVRLDAVLDVAEFLVEFLAYGAGLAVVAEDIALAGGGVVNLADGADDSGSTAGSGLLEGAEFLLGNLAAFYLHAEVEGQLLQALVGDGGQDGGGLGGDVGVVLDTEEVGCAAFVDILLLLGVEIELAGVACLVGDIVGLEAGGVVASHLILTGAEGCRAVVVAGDAVVGAGKATLEIGTYGRHEYQEQVYISARSIDEVNVQVIMERMGGGGHMTVAATQIKDISLNEAKEMLKNTLSQMIREGEL